MLNSLPQVNTELDEHISAIIHAYYPEKEVVLLDTQDGGKGLLAIGFRKKLEVYGDECIISDGQTSTRKKQNPWQALKDFRSDDDWYFGYLGYDLKNYTENLQSNNPDAVGAPDLFMIIPELLFEIDRVINECRQILGEEISFTDSTKINPKTELRFDDFSAQYQPYIEGIKQAQQEIFNGDYYEINLSRQISGTFVSDPFSLYLAMKSYGPVPFGSFVHTGKISVCCASPERFLKKTGQIIQSEPIKGTAPVSDDENENRKMLETLQSSEKNKAENLMIVDLVRNDFSRISIPGSVEVEELFRIYRFKTVFQMISKVKGVVEADACPIEIIKACFPMGSMTGAPKISAMKAIERLETYKRGIYSGAIGYIKPGSDFDFNVVIRSAICKGKTWYYSTGGAITSDSDPDEEWQETIVKTRALTGF